MARSRRTGRTRRYFVTIPADDAERLDAYAASVDRRPTTVAGELLLAGLAAATGQADDDLSAARRRIHELEHQLDTIFQEHRPPKPADSAPKGPRWEWPIEDLLADAPWWDRWLPSLYELLGRDLRSPGPDGAASVLGNEQPVVDSRGYGDLMSYLFPAVQGRGRELTWQMVEYAPAVAVTCQNTDGDVLQSVQSHVWEPVLRHVAIALCALEQSAQEGTDAQLRLDTQERITGSWVRILRNLVGETPVERLPRPTR